MSDLLVIVFVVNLIALTALLVVLLYEMAGHRRRDSARIAEILFEIDQIGAIVERLRPAEYVTARDGETLYTSHRDGGNA